MDEQNQTASYGTKYDSKRRFASYWHQIAEIISRKPAHVLEVGIGNGFVSRYIRQKGLQVTTVDAAAELRPDITADIRALPFSDHSYDLVTAFEIMEHIPFEDFGKALAELKRISSKYVIISLPDATRVLRVEFPLPGVGKFQRLITFPHLRAKIHTMTKSGHFWEIGKRGYPLSRIKAIIMGTGFAIEKTYRVYENPQHRFFILKLP